MQFKILPNLLRDFFREKYYKNSSSSKQSASEPIRASLGLNEAKNSGKNNQQNLRELAYSLVDVWVNAPQSLLETLIFRCKDIYDYAFKQKEDTEY